MLAHFALQKEQICDILIIRISPQQGGAGSPTCWQQDRAGTQNRPLSCFGTDATDESFEISSRVKGYFKNENVSYDEKVELFNDLLSTYYLYVIDKN